MQLLRKLRAIPKVKKVFIRSGIRYDYLIEDTNEEFITELIKHHVSGQLKVAPEHCSAMVLDKMGKPHIEAYKRFQKKFYEITGKIGKEQYLVPYLMSSHPGSTLKEAVDAAFAAYAREYKDCIYCIGSVLGPHPFPMMVRDFQSVVGIEAREQFLNMTGELPDAVVACVGGGSNAMGMFSGFLNDPVEIYGIEPLGRGTALGDHAASLQYGEEGIMHGFNSIMLKDENGDPAPVYSVASGLDYPSSGPEHAFLHDIGRVKYDVIDDEETIDAFFKLSRLEGIIPAIESAHAVAYGMKLAKKMGTGSILINLSGRGDKDMDFIIEKYGIR